MDDEDKHDLKILFIVILFWFVAACATIGPGTVTCPELDNWTINVVPQYVIEYECYEAGVRLKPGWVVQGCADHRTKTIWCEWEDVCNHEREHACGAGREIDGDWYEN